MDPAALVQLLPMVAIFAVMYFILIMPQKKKEKKIRAMINALQSGQNVITVGGIMGKVINIKEDDVTIETGVEKTKIKVKKWAIKEVEQLIES